MLATRENVLRIAVLERTAPGVAASADHELDALVVAKALGLGGGRVRAIGRGHCECVGGL